MKHKRDIQDKSEHLQKSLKALHVQAEKTKLLLDNFIPGAANELRYWKI